MCDKAILENIGSVDPVPTPIKIKKCVIKLLIITLLH